MIRCCLRCFLIGLTTAPLLVRPAVSVAEQGLSRVVLAGEAPRMARRLAAAEELVAHEKWAEAVDEYHRILTEAGDDLVPVDAGRSLQARRVCHLRLAALPRAALQLYRNRVDGQAKKWLEQGIATRDPVLLHRLIDEAFCSRYTDQALELLGDLAFERGDFEEAERYWRMLVVPASERERVTSRPRSAAAMLIFPDPQVDVARVRAKEILVRLFRGEHTGLQAELAAFRALHPLATGHLAGRDGLYAEILQTLSAQPEMLLAAARDRSWPTFGGSPTRNLRLPKPPGRWAHLRPLDGPQWTVRLDAEVRASAAENAGDSAGKIYPPLRESRSLAFHPVIHGGRVFVADARRVMGYSLLDGRRILRYDLAEHVPDDERRKLLRLKLALPAEPDLSYTLSVAGDRIYARLGAQDLGPARKDALSDPNRTYLVCLDLQFAVNVKLERWRVASKGTAGSGPVFEGAPVAGHGCVFIAESRFAGGQTQTAIACYDANTGKLRWQSDVCSTSREFSREEAKHGYRHHLVTLGGSTLFYCSHSGAIVALDALTGRRLWAIRYPSQTRQPFFGEVPPRDLCPCLYAGSRLYVAPLDSERILCLDSDTGSEVWAKSPVQTIQLLGIAKGRLIFTAATPRPCIRALDAVTGNDLRYWMQPADGTELKTFGRGVLAGDWVFWPVRSDRRQGVYVLDQETGEAVHYEDKINGNLAMGDGCLVVAGTRELSVYVAEEALLPRRREEAAQPGASARTRYRLALEEAAAGQYAEALADLKRLEETITPQDRVNGIPLQHLIRPRRHEMLLDAAEQAEREKQWEPAAQFLTEAASAKYPVFARLKALNQQAQLWIRAGQPERAVGLWQSILEDGELRGGMILSTDGNPQAAAGVASKRIAELIEVHGPAVYATIEARARSLLATGQTARRKEVLDRLGREFPNALVTGPALLELGQLHEQPSEFGAAARAYHRFLLRSSREGKSSVSSFDESERPRALAGLARAYQQEGCWSEASATWNRLATEQGDRIVAAVDQEHTVRVFVAAQLQKIEYHFATNSLRPELSLPLTRVWQSAPTRPDGQLFVAAARVPCHGNESKYLFAVRGCTLSCLEGLTGKHCWTATLPQTARWIGCFADTVVAAGADSICGLSQSDGVRLWSLSLAMDDHLVHLDAFQLAGPRLFCLQDERRLIAIDVLDGDVLWTCWAPAARFDLPAPSGRFRASYLVGEDSLVIQTGVGPWLVLDSRTGRRLRESDQACSPWPWPPVPLDERHVCLQTDSEHLVLLDAKTGADRWTYSVESPSSLTGEALQILGNRDALLILVSRNYGYFLECLDPRTGSRRWPNPCYLGTLPTDLVGGTLDDSAVYLVQNNTLLARALADGRLLWKQPLPSAGRHWQTLRTQNSLVAFPRYGTAVEWRWRWLFVTAQVRLMFGGNEPGTVLICDRRTGQVMQRLNFPAMPPQMGLQCRFDPIPAVVPRFSRIILPPDRWEPVVHIFEQGMAVERGGQAWGLRAYTATRSDQAGTHDLPPASAPPRQALP